MQISPKKQSLHPLYITLIIMFTTTPPALLKSIPFRHQLCVNREFRQRERGLAQGHPAPFQGFLCNPDSQSQVFLCQLSVQGCFLLLKVALRLRGTVSIKSRLSDVREVPLN